MERLIEKEFRNRMDVHLEKYFNIQREVRSSCGTGRLDYVLQNKKTLELYGIEAKRSHKLTGEKMGKNLLQCKRYTTLTWETDFGRHIRLPIFLLPGISEQFVQIDLDRPNWCKKLDSNDIRMYYRAFHNHNVAHHNLNSLISTAFNIGEVKKAEFHDNYLNNVIMFFFSFNNEIIWSQNRGVNKKKYNYLMKKVNSL